VLCDFSHAVQPCNKEEESMLELWLEKVVNGPKNVTFIGTTINIGDL